MIGIPKILKTRADYERLHAAALAGELRPHQVAALLGRWQALLERHHYVYDRVLAADESPDGPEPDYRAITETAEDGTETRSQYRREEDPTARIHAIGFSVAEAEAAITDLEAVING